MTITKFKKDEVSNFENTSFVFPKATDMEDVLISFNQKKGTLSLTGTKDGYQYAQFCDKEENGKITIQTAFKKNLGKEKKSLQVKKLLKKGYTQQEVASMLGISQSSVSRYSRY